MLKAQGLPILSTSFSEVKTKLQNLKTKAPSIEIAAKVLAQEIDEKKIYVSSENLQLFSATFSKNGTCPLQVPTCQENSDGYCVITGKPKNVVRKTRGLNMKKRKKKVEKAEANVSFTTFKR